MFYWNDLFCICLYYYTGLILFFFLSLFFNWRKIALQCCVSTIQQLESVVITYIITSLGLPPPHSTATPILPLQVVSEHLAELQGLVLNDLIPRHLTPCLAQTGHLVIVELNYSFLNMVHLTGEINSSSLWGGRLGLRVKRFYCIYFGSSCLFPHLLIFPMKNKNDEKEMLNLYEL